MTETTYRVYLIDGSDGYSAGTYGYTIHGVFEQREAVVSEKRKPKPNRDGEAKHSVRVIRARTAVRDGGIGEIVTFATLGGDDSLAAIARELGLTRHRSHSPQCPPQTHVTADDQD